MFRPNILFIMDDQHRFDYLGVAAARKPGTAPTVSVWAPT